MCRYKFTDVYTYLGHLRQNHLKSSNFHVKCFRRRCTSSFNNFNSFRMHIYKKHGALIKSRKKEVCDEHDEQDEQVEELDKSEMSIGDESEQEVQVHDVPGNTSVLKNMAMFLLKSRELHLMPRATLEKVVGDLREFLMPSLEACNNPEHGSLITVLESFSSDYKLNKYCRDSLSLIDPTCYKLGEAVVNGRAVSHTFQYISILETLKQYVKIPEIMSAIEKEQANSSFSLSSYRDGQYFKDSAFLRKHPKALRLILYLDEFEVSNPLGPKRGMHKLMPVYFMIDNLDAQQKSSLKNIHLCLLVKYKYIKQYVYDVILKPIFDDLFVLENEGLSIEINGMEQIYHGTAIALCGDNLSSNAVGGFSQNFNAGRICRFCMATKEQTLVKTKESQFVMRTPKTYKKHVGAIEADDAFIKIYGVRHNCIFNGLQHFDATTSLPADIMHDLLEGNYWWACLKKAFIKYV